MGCCENKSLQKIQRILGKMHALQSISDISKSS